MQFLLRIKQLAQGWTNWHKIPTLACSVTVLRIVVALE